MKRDMDLIRLILLDAEGEVPADLSQYSEKQINYHKWLLFNAGFVEGGDDTDWSGNKSAVITGLNWEGHDFLDAARDPGIWNQAKETLGTQFATVSIDVLKALLVTLLKDQLGLT